MDTKASRVVPTLYFLMDCMLEQLIIAAEYASPDMSFDTWSRAWNRVEAMGDSLFAVVDELDYYYENKNYECFARWRNMRNNWLNLVMNTSNDELHKAKSVLEQMRTDGEIALTIAYLLYGEKAYKHD